MPEGVSLITGNPVSDLHIIYIADTRVYINSVQGLLEGRKQIWGKQEGEETLQIAPLACSGIEYDDSNQSSSSSLTCRVHMPLILHNIPKTIIDLFVKCFW